jgi:hypothetical protein
MVILAPLGPIRLYHTHACICAHGILCHAASAGKNPWETNPGLDPQESPASQNAILRICIFQLDIADVGHTRNA